MDGQTQEHSMCSFRITNPELLIGRMTVYLIFLYVQYRVEYVVGFMFIASGPFQ